MYNLVVSSSTCILPGNNVAPLLKESRPSLNIPFLKQDQVFTEASMTHKYTLRQLSITGHDKRAFTLTKLCA